MIINFTKMHGLGNDFMVIDAINQDISLSSQDIRFLSDRNFGIGFDQLLLVENPDSSRRRRSNADFVYRIFNADGGEVAQCGNGARCFALFVLDNHLSFPDKKLFNKENIIVDTHSGQLTLSFDEDNLIIVNMGLPEFQPHQIPISASKEKPFYNLDLRIAKPITNFPLHVIAAEDILSITTNIYFGAVSMGNPHAVIEVNDIGNYPVERVGEELEKHQFFPEHANIGFMEIKNRRSINLRVYERGGTGETLACGSGACAAVVIGIEQDLLDEGCIIEVQLTHGILLIKWDGREQPVYMRGPATSVFEGQIEI